MISAWRIVKEKYADAAFSGEGARQAGGRFNSVGVPVVYTSSSLALAQLEILVNLPTERLLSSYVAFRVRFDETLVQPVGDLPANWRQNPAPRSVKTVGDRWVASERSLVLRVPSAVVPAERNYLINPRHPDVDKLEIEGPFDPQIDPRLQ